MVVDAALAKAYLHNCKMGLMGCLDTLILYPEVIFPKYGRVSLLVKLTLELFYIFEAFLHFCLLIYLIIFIIILVQFIF